MINDIRYGLRQLIKHPAFTLVAVLTLAIGIGANTAIFSVVNAVLLKPLPFPSPEQLIAVGSLDTRQKTSPPQLSSLSYPDFFDLRDQNHTLSHIAVFRDQSFSLVDQQEVKSILGNMVSAEFFDVLDIQPQLGRNFSRSDEQAGGGAGGLKVILTHAFWQRQFESDPTVLGRVLVLNGAPHAVIGVLPASFHLPVQPEPDIYVTIAGDASMADGTKPVTEQRGNHGLEAIARLKPNVSLAEATSDLGTVAAALSKQYPDTNTIYGIALRPLRDQLVGDVRVGLYVLFGAVVCVLLIANVNVANLLLARASVRGKEIALRAALGASRGRIVRQLLTESLILASVGGALGLLIAQWGTEVLIAAVPESIPRAASIRLDAAVLGFTLLISLATGIIFGVVPAWQASHIDLNRALKTGSRGTGGAQGKHRVRNGLVMVEVALALVLLVCSGLLIQSFARLGRVQTGVQTDHLLTARLDLPDVAYPRPENITAFFDQFLSRIRALPGVESASTIAPLPLSDSNMTSSFDIEEHPMPKGQRPSSPVRIADRDYFKTVGIPLLQGRLFAETDQLKSLPVVIVNERFAQKYFPGQNPIGKRIQPGWTIDDNPPLMRDIIGVVGNVKHRSLAVDFTPEMYLAAAQIPIGFPSLVVRTKLSNPATITAAIRTELASVDRTIPLRSVRVFDEYLSRALARPRFNALLLSIFGGTALLLTGIGIYGVMAYSVAQRTSEIGIRIALGAGKSSIFRLVVGQAMLLVAISVVIGLAGAFAATRFLSSLLFGVGASDPITFVSIVLVVAVVAFIAAWLPARRAARVDPIIALRAE